MHLLRRLTQLENDLDGMCKELHRRRSPLKRSNSSQLRTLPGQSNQSTRRASPKRQSSKPSSRGDLRRTPKSASAASLQPTLEAVLETPSSAARRVGASREDESKPRCDAEVAVPKPSPSQSTTTAGRGSSSSGSFAALPTVASVTSLNTAVFPHESVSDASSDRCPQQVDPQLLTLAKSPCSRFLGPSVPKSVGMPVERVELGDSGDSVPTAKDDLVWRLELQRLRNATLELHVQREMCESSDLRKRLWENEAQALTPSKARLMQSLSMQGVPTVAASCTAPARTPSVARLQDVARFASPGPRAGVAQVQRTLSTAALSPGIETASWPLSDGVVTASTPRCVEASNHRALQFSPRHRSAASLLAPVSPRLQ